MKVERTSFKKEETKKGRKDKKRAKRQIQHVKKNWWDSRAKKAAAVGICLQKQYTSGDTYWLQSESLNISVNLLEIKKSKKNPKY